MELKEDDLVLCTVTQIEGATVFVELEDGKKGSISMSEIAAGRIRNLREYVVINKKIVCKVLKVEKNNLELSLRRVTGRERDELLDKYKKEKTASALLKAVLKDSNSIDRIKKDMPLAEFVAKSKEDSKIASKYLTKEEIENLEKTFSEKQEKEKNSKAVVTIKSFSSTGIEDIKEILEETKGISISYLGSGKFSVISTSQDFKEAKNKLDSTLESMQKKAKEKKMVFEISQ